MIKYVNTDIVMQISYKVVNIKEECMKKTTEKLAHIQELLEEGSSGLDGLIGYLKDDSEDVRLATIVALGDLEDELATEPLLRQYQIESLPEMENAVILAICNLDDERAYDLVKSVIAESSTNDEVLYACLLTLTGMGKTLDVSVIAANHGDERYRRLAQDALDTLEP